MTREQRRRVRKAIDDDATIGVEFDIKQLDRGATAVVDIDGEELVRLTVPPGSSAADVIRIVREWGRQ